MANLFRFLFNKRNLNLAGAYIARSSLAARSITQDLLFGHVDASSSITEVSDTLAAISYGVIHSSSSITEVSDTLAANATSGSSTPPDPWTPAVLMSSVFLWIKGDTLVEASGADIDVWSDSSNNAFYVATPGAPNAPTVASTLLNGMKVANFDADSLQYVYAVAKFESRKSYLGGSIFIISKLNASPPATYGKAGPAIGGYGGHSLDVSQSPATDGNFYDDYGSTVVHTVSGVSASTSWRMIEMRSKDNDWRFDVNATNIFSTTTNTFSIDSYAAFLGANASFDTFFDGQIAEVIEFSTFLPDSEKQKVEGYLMWKWGLQASLPSGHPYASAAPPTSPTILIEPEFGVSSGDTLAISLSASETVTWSITGGSDSAKFEVSGSVLRWLSNGVKNYTSPDDADADNRYAVYITATNSLGYSTTKSIFVTVLNVTSYRYWRVRAASTNVEGNYFSIANIELRNLAGTDLTTGKTGSASADDGTNYASLAIDSDELFTYWYSGTATAPTGGHWYQVDLTTPQLITEVRIANSIDYGNYSANCLVVEGSNDGSTFTFVKGFNSFATTYSGQKKIYSTIPDTITYPEGCVQRTSHRSYVSQPSIVLPKRSTVGNTLVAMIVGYAGSGSGVDFLAPTGWTGVLLDSTSVSNNHVAIFKRVVQSGDDAAITFPRPNSSAFPTNIMLVEFTGSVTPTAYSGAASSSGSVESAGVTYTTSTLQYLAVEHDTTSSYVSYTGPATLLYDSTFDDYNSVGHPAVFFQVTGTGTVATTFSDTVSLPIYAGFSVPVSVTVPTIRRRLTMSWFQ